MCHLGNNTFEKKQVNFCVYPATTSVTVFLVPYKYTYHLLQDLLKSLYLILEVYMNMIHCIVVICLKKVVICIKAKCLSIYS
ncbi:hypothetical protein EDC94DRAFT_619218, partial [Helicostylum pulchrum]